MPFRTLLSPSSLRDKNKLNFSDQCQTKFLLPKSQNEFYDLLTIPSCTPWSSSTKTKAKDMENILIFHVTLRIQILTAFSVQSKYSKKTKSILLLGFVISNKTCKIWNVQIQCQPSRLSSPSRWKPNSFLPMQKRPMDSSHHRCQIFTPRLTEACPRHEDKARLTGTRIYIILLLGSLSNDWWCGSGTLWCLLDLQKYCCLWKVRQFWQKKVTAESHFRSWKKNIGLGLQEVVLPSCVEKLMVKQSPTLIHLRHAKTFLCESLVRGCTVYWTTLNLLEHL